MAKKVAIIISPNWRDYAKKYLTDCLVGVRTQDWTGESKLFLVDNETSEESYAYLKSQAPEAEIIRNVDNAGFAKGNNVAMRSAMEQGFDYVLLLNMDTIAHQSAVSELVKAVERDESIGAVQARLMLWPDKEKVNSLGNATHFMGFGYCEGYGNDGAKLDLKSMEDKAIFYPSGAAVMFTAEALRTIGLFDEVLWMYNEDQDLGWRIWLAGLRCHLAPQAVVFHKYEFSRSISKYYWMDRNRLVVIFKNYKLATIILILPAMLIMEVGQLLFAAKGGWFKEKLRVYAYFLYPGSWRYILAGRRGVKNLRKVPDRAIINMLASRIEFQELESLPLRIANIIFTVYWRAIKRLIVW
ncbi:glycosyltransferase family 2 protein [Candidatus Falkowbacteria bacterium]|nr:glycosyltransferase family 2 protein [Candidatus Falkowbacteria bacterium]